MDVVVVRVHSQPLTFTLTLLSLTRQKLSFLKSLGATSVLPGALLIHRLLCLQGGHSVLQQGGFFRSPVDPKSVQKLEAVFCSSS